MKTIEINTSFNVTIKFNLASLWERILAYLIDMMIVWASIGLILWFFIAILSSPSNYLFYYIAVPIFGFYTLIMETFYNGQSIGKKAMKIKVVRIDGKRTRTSDYFMRWIFRLIDIYSSISLLAILTISSSQRAQRLGDILADTCVIRVKENPEASLSSILKLNKLQNQSVTYPEIIKLTESEMLIVKESIDRYKKYPNEAHQKAIDTLVETLENILEVQCKTDKIKFLSELIRDYVILTR